MTDTAKKFSNLDEQTARAFLRESAIGRQQQAGSLKDDQVSSIRQGRQDQSLGSDDFVYGLTHADSIWPQVEANMGQQQS